MRTLDAQTGGSSWLEDALLVLRRGGLVAFPTETVYGLGGRALDPAALVRIFAAKGRPSTHPLIAHVAGVAEARLLALAWPPEAERLATAFWPGPLTLVVPRALHVPRELTGGGQTVAVRAPSHPVARTLLVALGEPIAAPSANRYQSVSPTTAAHVERSLGERVDLILDGGPCASGIESTVVDVSGDTPSVLRLGALDLPTLQTIEPRLRVATVTFLREEVAHPSPGMDLRHYSPQAPLVLCADRDAVLREAERRCRDGQEVAVLLLEPLSDEDSPAGTCVLPLGSSAGAYARSLYAALHRCDDIPGLAVVLVEPVPDTPEWAAIADRLRRAAGPR